MNNHTKFEKPKNMTPIALNSESPQGLLGEVLVQISWFGSKLISFGTKYYDKGHSSYYFLPCSPLTTSRR